MNKAIQIAMILVLAAINFACIIVTSYWLDWIRMSDPLTWSVGISLSIHMAENLVCDQKGGE